MLNVSLKTETLEESRKFFNWMGNTEVAVEAEANEGIVEVEEENEDEDEGDKSGLDVIHKLFGFLRKKTRLVAGTMLLPLWVKKKVIAVLMGSKKKKKKPLSVVAQVSAEEWHSTLMSAEETEQVMCRLPERSVNQKPICLYLATGKAGKTFHVQQCVN